MARRRSILFCFLIITTLTFSMDSKAQDPTYRQEWKEVEKAISEGLPKTALSTIDKIYKLAKASKNEGQVIKCLLYKSSQLQSIEEDAAKKVISSMKEEIATAPQPARSVMQNITAQFYEDYFSRNRYRLYSATQTKDFKKEDIDTWSKEDFFREISYLYLESLKDKSLKTTPIQDFDAILNKGNSRNLRPTLFDLLAHRALSFFKNPEIIITKPAEAFEITSSQAFSPAKEFIHTAFKTSDTSSAALIALNIFKELIALHIDQTDALIDVDIDRLKYVHNNARITNKDDLYIGALKNIYYTYKDTSAAIAGYLWGEMLMTRAETETDRTKKGHLMKEAFDIMKIVTSDYPESKGGSLASNAIMSITHQSLSLTVENVNIPGKNFRALVEYKNISGMYLRVIPSTGRLKQQLAKANNQSEKIKIYESLRYRKQWFQQLPAMADYLMHSAEIRIEGLPVGEYLLLASPDKDFRNEKNVVSVTPFHVSNISFIKNANNVLVLNRTSGAPLAGAIIKVWSGLYNYDTRTYKQNLVTTVTTDSRGMAKITYNRSLLIRLEITHNKDRLFLDHNEYYYPTSANQEKIDTSISQDKYEKKNARIFYFTDRSIYRPGQTVYLKIIGVTRDRETGNPKLLQSKKPLSITLYDANGQKSESVKGELNEYGSLSTKFTLPQGKLNGTFRIEVDGYSTYSHYISVEEYKRPKFFTEIKQPKESFRLNDSVSISGEAIAYAGNQISGARVTYRVTRIARFPYPWRFWRIGIPSTVPMEIENGETTTDQNGKFYITFKAIPDLSINPDNDPVFDYRVTADVTDINGETRSAESIITVGYKSLNLSLALSNKAIMRVNEFKKVSVSARNLSNEPQEVKVDLKIYELKTPKRVLRSRLWQIPDTTVMSEADFVSFFPNDVYRSEDQPETWERLATVYEKSDSLNGNGDFSLGKELKTGWYVAVARSKDRFGNEVEDVKYFSIFNPESRKLPDNSIFFISDKSLTTQPGDNKTIYAGSASDVYLFEETITEKSEESKEHNFSMTRVNNSLHPFKFTIHEADRGGFAKNYFFVRDNRFYSTQVYVAVPWDNKKLNIRFDTYREKTQPGSKEEWRLTITGDKNTKAAAELLAGMYDASLDQFKPQKWSPLNIWYNFYPRNNWTTSGNFTLKHAENYDYPDNYVYYPVTSYDEIILIERPWGFYPQVSPRQYDALALNRVTMEKSAAPSPSGGMGELQEVIAVAPGVNTDTVAAKTEESNNATENNQPQKTRTDFRETAFFYPQLRTDQDGNVTLSFTMPEALTKWKLMTLAHTQDLSSGYAEQLVITQKELMVIPNPPRFFREGDSILFTAKVVNMTDREISGQTEFHLLNSSTLLSVDGWFENNTTEKPFTVAAGQSVAVSFSFKVPKGFNDLVTYRIIAQAGNMSDGEEAYVPVVTNRMLVTESLPIPMKKTGSQKFSFEKLLKSGSNTTLSNYGLTVEYTPNPAWYAVQALPYLNEYPYECTEQVFNRYFANALAMHIANASPRLKTIFDKWRTQNADALLSNLQKNQELKSVLLEETPWVMQAKSEEEQKRRIALLFDLNKMSSQLDNALRTVKERQTSNGGFPWFTSGPDDRYITQYILADLGHLKTLQAWPEKNNKDLNAIAIRGLDYLDRRIAEDYQRLKKLKGFKESDNHLSNISVHYLYTRSFFKDIPIRKEAQAAYDFYFNQAKKFWTSQGIYARGMIALMLYRAGESKVSTNIIKSLRENAIVNSELGMYWKELTQRSYWWYQAPIETQSLMIEVFSEVAKDAVAVSEMKTWLLKNKQTNSWGTTKATAEAVYALLLQGDNWFTADKQVQISLGNQIFDNKNEKQEEGTGYFKRMIDGVRVKPEMGNIKVTVTEEGKKSGTVNPSWGAVYWQYFEDLDKITFSETNLKLSKKLFLQKNTDRGPVLMPINEGDKLAVGDKITVRIELRADRDMEYVHMKDMRASCMEPIEVLSGYRWQGGLGYYQSTKDVSTNFFFSYLPKGTYVFEYSMFVTHEGDFSNGITSIQSMYAPEFTAHSEGVRVSVGDR